MARSPKKEILQMQIDPEVKDRLREIAKRENRSMSGQIEYLLRREIERYIEEHELEKSDKNPT